MRILFLHQNFPAQFRHVAAALAQDKNNQVFFGTTRQEGSLAGVNRVVYNPKREARPETHHYVKPLENAVLQGQAVYRLAEQLKAQRFVPDVVYGHSGWGPTLFIKDIFPKAKLLCYFEWFYHAHGTDADFDPSDRMTADDEARIRIKNAPILQDLYSCDRGLSPTYWQRQQFPLEYHNKITVMHDGVDTNFFSPNPGAKLVLPRINLDLSHAEEIVTYATRGMEPYRGFPQFIEAVALLQQQRPNCHVVIVGENRVAYGKKLPDGKTYKEVMLEKYDLDLSRIHFTGWLPYSEYLQVLQASSAHVYLTRPFVLSWSLIESLATGCLVVGSRTAPVMEVIQDGVNGLLADFFSPQEICDRILEALNHPDKMAAIRAKARQTVLERYDLAQLLPQHLQWIQQSEEPQLISPWEGRKLELVDSSESKGFGKQQKAQKSLAKSAQILQVNHQTLTTQEIIPLLSRYQLLPKLQQELIIDSAIAAFTCSNEEKTQCYQEFCAQNQLSSEAERQAWLKQQGMNEAQFLDLATRNLRIEKFKKATWGSKLENHFRQIKPKLDRVVYSLIRLRDGAVAQELYFRLLEGEQSFAELAKQYSQGAEAQTDGLIGPVSLSTPHPQLARILAISQPGQLLPPKNIGDLWLIVRLEKFIPAQFDKPMQQRLLNELFAAWLKEQMQKTAQSQSVDIQHSA
ncbi:MULTISPECIES: glycosyltransferase [Calothrix]|uniref:Glycosyltransferase n=2 Tax=Calothrix TaxID=1186 RepID=A0ABR8AKF5_9CYAN|nr:MULTISPECIES: glycosyltransferase [Calothrix]MBD2200507.1 glycosyltransferase [Calothrix parietina FACHB-288]MBD2229524.1 glycosyltransferase [Calothrix anomala FACHB-343]